MALNKQIHIYSIDTGAFYTDYERCLHWRLCNLKTIKNEIKEYVKKGKFREKLHEFVPDDEQLKILISMKDKESPTLLHSLSSMDNFKEFSQILVEYQRCLYKQKQVNQLIHNVKNKLLKILEDAVKYNNTNSEKHIRELSQTAMTDKNIISIFDSSLTRMLGIQQNELTTDIMVVKVFYFDILKDLIENGYIYNGEVYKFFTSSAGQIRTKKTVFIKQSLWNTYEKTLMCGLTMKDINAKGGINVNKYLAYLALSNSATDEWKDFNIRKCIVVDDFETMVNGTVDFIDDKTYKIERKKMDIPITHTDGCGMMLESISKKNMMVRLPWVKGLLGVFPFKTFIEQANKDNPSVNYGIVKDIYNKSHDIIAEDIQIIFTKSQFKMYKYYDSWDKYVEDFEAYHCQAGYCNLEEDNIKNAKINYQMVQTLNNMTDAELLALTKMSTNKIEDISTTVRSMLDVFGVTKYNTNKTYLQQALEIYPSLLNDVYTKDVLRGIKQSLVKNYKAAKLDIRGKYTFLLPDLYAFSEYLFLGKKNPKGLLKNNEISCRLYKNINKLDCLRSPHLYREHAVRNNVVSPIISNWFTTDAVYTSCFDLISKILQFDVDGDKSLVVSDRNLVSVADRHMKGIAPLYYDMQKAAPVQLDGKTIYGGLNAAYTGGNIGAISNDITKIWNSGDTSEDAMKAIKFLCMENNFTIDYAKTLYKPTRPDEINKLIKQYTKAKVPYFFMYAKDKTENQVEPINDSVVNKLDNIIKDKRLKFSLKEFGKLDYILLMNDPDIEIDNDLLQEYIKMNGKYHYKINMEDCEADNKKVIAEDIRNNLAKYNYSDIDITDMLIKYLYGIKHSKSKESLWFCYGKVIVENLKRNIDKKTSTCQQCGKRFEKVTNNQIYCEECSYEIEYDSYQPIGTKFITCIDCDSDVEVKAWDMKTKRCEKCQHQNDKERKRKWKQNNKK